MNSSIGDHQPSLKVGSLVPALGRQWRLKRLVGQGKSALCWLGETLPESGDGPQQKPDSLVIKEFRYHRDNYIPLEENLHREEEAYRSLLHQGIPLARLYGRDPDRNLLFKEFCFGFSAAQLIGRGELSQEKLKAMTLLALRCEAAGFTIDYFPPNYFFRENQPVLVDYEMNPYSDEWNFRNWGIYYWFNRRGMKEYCETGKADLLNLPGQPKPIKEPYEAEVSAFWNSLSPGISGAEYPPEGRPCGG